MAIAGAAKSESQRGTKNGGAPKKKNTATWFFVHRIFKSGDLRQLLARISPGVIVLA